MVWVWGPTPSITGDLAELSKILQHGSTEHSCGRHKQLSEPTADGMYNSRDDCVLSAPAGSSAYDYPGSAVGLGNTMADFASRAQKIADDPVELATQNSFNTPQKERTKAKRRIHKEELHAAEAAKASKGPKADKAAGPAARRSGHTRGPSTGRGDNDGDSSPKRARRQLELNLQIAKLQYEVHTGQAPDRSDSYGADHRGGSHQGHRGGGHRGYRPDKRNRLDFDPSIQFQSGFYDFITAQPVNPSVEEACGWFDETCFELNQRLDAFNLSESDKTLISDLHFAELDPAEQVCIYKAPAFLREQLMGLRRDILASVEYITPADQSDIEDIKNHMWEMAMSVLNRLTSAEHATDFADEGSPPRQLARTPATKRMATGGTLQRQPLASRPTQPRFSPEPEEDERIGPNIIGHNKVSIHPFNFGLNRDVFSCTGALMAVLGRERANLWQWHQGQGDNPLPVHLDTHNRWGYDYNLHDELLATMQLSHQHSLLHAAMCVPVCALQVHGQEGVDVSFKEPSYPYCNVESELPIPGASYSCATDQQLFVYLYIEGMHERCPGATALGTAQQRALFSNLPKVKYSREELSDAAIRAQQVAMQEVFRQTRHTPVMGLCMYAHRQFNHQSQYNRVHPTDAFDGREMLTHIPDCQCQYCQQIHSRQRFNVQAMDGPAAFDDYNLA